MDLNQAGDVRPTVVFEAVLWLEFYDVVFPGVHSRRLSRDPRILHLVVLFCLVHLGCDRSWISVVLLQSVEIENITAHIILLHLDLTPEIYLLDRLVIESSFKTRDFFNDFKLQLQCRQLKLNLIYDIVNRFKC